MVLLFMILLQHIMDGFRLVDTALLYRLVLLRMQLLRLMNRLFRLHKHLVLYRVWLDLVRVILWKLLLLHYLPFVRLMLILRDLLKLGLKNGNKLGAT